jgi:hypothetical protein
MCFELVVCKDGSFFESIQWWEYHLRRGGNPLSRERWDWRRFDGATKDVGHLRIGIEDGRTKGEWVVERGSFGAL